jgi:CubicO group peptidase (beta-lactamase class C family)
VWHDGRLVRERYYRGASAARPANVKSASKSIVSALVGVAIAEGALPGVRQPLGAALPAAVARAAAAGGPGQAEHLRAVTVEDLLTMRSGLSSTSGPFYGRWVASGDWVAAALARPVVAPAGHAGGPMIYSTGNTHVLSAVLARATGESLYRYYARALARPLGITPRPWPADARGVYFGGNEMRLTPREMVTFGRLYLEGGRAPAGTPAAGRQLVPRAWVDSSWAPRTRSPWSGEEYGYGWFLHTVAGARAAHPVRYAWGYGGQFIFVAPTLGLVMVTTSDPDAPRDPGHLGAIRAILERYVVPYAEAAAAPTTG